jgi:hypothetical protein
MTRRPRRRSGSHRPLVDVAYGVLWYRLLIGHAPLDQGAARDLGAHLIAAGAAQASSSDEGG